MKKTLIIIFSVVAVLIIGAYFYLKFRKAEDFEPLIIAKLQQLVKDGSNGLYILTIDKLDADVLKSQVYVHNAKLTIDSAKLKELDAQGKAPVDVYKISLSDLAIDGLSINDLLQKKNIDLNILNIKNPYVEIYHPVSKNTKVSKDTSTLYSRIAKGLGHFYIKTFAISNMTFNYHNVENQEKLTAFKNISMKFNDIEIDSATQFDTTRFLYAKDAAIYLNNYSLRTNDSLYFILADSLTLHAAQGNLDVVNLKLQPRGDKAAFSKKLTFYKDRYDIKFAKASFKKIDWYHLFLSEGFAAEEGELSNGTLEVYANRNLTSSGKSKIGNYPHQLLTKLDFPVNVKKLTINNLKVSYQELNPKTQKSGTLVFDKANGIITNITNIKENIAANNILKVQASCSLMDAAKLDAVFSFDLTKAKTGNFSVDANLAAMNGTVLNPVCMPLGLFQINNASIKKLTAHISANNNSGSGTVLFMYDDLDITALKKDDDSKQLKKRKFLSFIANTFIINKSNNTSFSPKQVTIKRDPSRSFFSLIWKAILQGVTETVS